MIDGADAAIHGVAEGNVVSFICHLNLVGWARLVMLVFKELKIRYGSLIEEAILEFVNGVLSEVRLPAEQKRIKEFFGRLDRYDKELALILREFIISVEKEYEAIYGEIQKTFDKLKTSSQRAIHSVKLADAMEVEEQRIAKSHKDLDELLG